MICVSDRRLVAGDFLDWVRSVCAGQPRCLLLREKDLDEVSYGKLSREVAAICAAAGTPLVLRGANFGALAEELGAGIHLSFPEALEWFGLDRGLPAPQAQSVPASVSIHSYQEAQALRGADVAFFLAGHVFESQCKPGQPGRGVNFLRTVASQADAPVFAIGGITAENAAATTAAGAAGIAAISHLSEHPTTRLAALQGVIS